MPEVLDYVKEARQAARLDVTGCLRAAKLRTVKFYNKGNESATDFAYALALYRRGYTRAEIYNRIVEERQDWSNHGGSRKRTQYLNRTLLKAEEIID